MASPKAPRRRRRTQEERRNETRALLLDVTIECLFELGYAGTTTTEVADRAGLSRGAQLHHFGNKQQLVVAAMEQLFQRRLEEFRQGLEQLPEGADVVEAAVRLLWKIFSGPTYYAYMELVVAARTDPELNEVIVELNRGFDEQVDVVFQEFFADTPETEGYYDVIWTGVLALMGGLAFERIIRPGDDRIERVVQLLGTAGHGVLKPKGKP